MMTGGTRWHALVVGNTYELLRRKLDRNRWTVLTEFGVALVKHLDRALSAPYPAGGGESEARHQLGPTARLFRFFCHGPLSC